VKLRGTKAGRPMKIVVNKDGRTRVVVDHKAILAKKPVCARHPSPNRMKVSRNPRPKGG
jgi:hypothetical protein